MQGNIIRRHVITQQRQEFCSHFFMHQQRFHRITDTRTLHFGIADDRQRFMQIRRLIDKNMTHADTAGDHRDRGLLTTQTMQTGTAARNKNIHIAIHLQQFIDQRTIRGINRLDRRLRQATLTERLLNNTDHRHIGIVCLFAAAQDHRITGFQAQRGNIHRHIRACFINHTDHTERHTAALKAQTTFQHTAVDHFPDRIRQLTHLTHVRSNTFQACLRQQQAIKHRL